jgi:hypothetical protein
MTEFHKPQKITGSAKKCPFCLFKIGDLSAFILNIGQQVSRGITLEYEWGCLVAPFKYFDVEGKTCRVRLAAPLRLVKIFHSVRQAAPYAFFEM